MPLEISRTEVERKPSARRSPAATSPASLPRTSILLTICVPVSVHGFDEGGDLAVPQAVGAAVGYKAGGGGRDVVHDLKVVLPQGGACGGQVHYGVGEADERG